MIRNTSDQQLCDDEKLMAVLSDGEQAAEHQNVIEHIEHCPRCQQRFDELAAQAQDWTKVRQALLNGDPYSGNGVGSATWLDSLRNEVPIAWTESMATQLLSPAPHPELLGRLGRYDVERLIGSGGMGIVFKAHDSELNRPVAIKILAPYLSSSGPARKRFAREARAAAAVVHEHVVPIYNVETERETPFLVMHYIAGESLQGRIDREGALELCEILRIGMQVASGLSAAHQQGLVHRDIKPSNILMEQGVERALITDFGLARAADDASLTRTGFHPGTPQYMSPEQAAGEQIDARSDLFSLGSVLYTMCTGRPPFRAETSLGVLRRITDVEPRSIREINPNIPEWLCLLIARLMSKSRDERFANAIEVADLLEQCLAHVQQPTSALPASLIPQPACRRSFFKPIRTGVIAMLGTIGTALLGMVLWQVTEAPDISGQWTDDEWGTVVLKANEPGQYEGTFTRPGNDTMSEAIDKSSGTLKLRWSRVERRFNGTWGKGADRRGAISLRMVNHEIRGGWTTDEDIQLESGTPLLGDLLWKRRVVKLPDGGTVLLGGRKELPGSPSPLDQASIRWGEPVNGLRLGAKFEGANKLEAMQFHHGDRANIQLFLQNVSDHETECGFDPADVCKWHNTPSPDPSKKPPVEVLRIKQTNGETIKPEPLRNSDGSRGHYTFAPLSSNYAKLLPNEIRRIDSQLAALHLKVRPAPEVQVKDFVSFNIVAQKSAEPAQRHPQEYVLPSGKYKVEMDINFFKRGKQLRLECPALEFVVDDAPMPTELVPENAASALDSTHAFGKPMRFLSVSQVLKEGQGLEESREVVAVQFRVANARPAKVLADPQEDIWERWWSLSSEKAPYDKNQVAFEVKISPEALDELKKNGVEDIAKYFVSKALEVEGRVHTIGLGGHRELRPNNLTYGIDVYSLRQIREAESDTAPTTDEDFSIGHQVPLLKNDDSKSPVDAASTLHGQWEMKQVFNPAHDQMVWAIAFTPDGKTIASAGADKRIKLWDVASGSLSSTLLRPVNCTDVTYSKNGLYMAIAGGDHGENSKGEVVLLETGGNEEEFVLESHENARYVKSVAFSPDCKWLASGGSDMTVKIWDVEQRELRAILTDHTDLVSQVAFSPDGKILASASFDNTVKLWSVPDGDVIATLRGHQKEVRGIAFSPDSTMLVSVGDDGTARLWNASSGESLRLMVGNTGPILSIAFSPDGRYFATGSRGPSTLTIWDVNSRKSLSPVVIPQQKREVVSLAFSSDGQMLAIAGNWNGFQIWNRKASEARTSENETAIDGGSNNPSEKP